MDQANIVRLFIAAAERSPGKTAFIQDGTDISYGELLIQVKKQAAYFRSRQVGECDRVLVFVRPGIALYRIVLALFYIGAVPVFLDEWVNIRRLKACLAVVPCKALIAPQRFLWLSRLIAPLRRIGIKISPDTRLPGPLHDAPAPVLPDDTALITFTTGSTGTPKAANRTHALLQAQQQALHPLLDHSCRLFFTLLPVVTLLHLAAGDTTLLPPSAYRPNKPRTFHYIAAALLRFRPDAVIASPAILLHMAETIISRHADAGFVRQVLTGGGPVFPEDTVPLQQAFPGADPLIVYGSTEAEPISHIRASQLRQTDAGTLETYGLPVGIPDPAATVAVIPVTDAPVPAQTGTSWRALQLHGQPGEIVVSGRHVLQAYIHNETAQQRYKIPVEDVIWHRTGDAGLLAADGQLYLLGRCDEIIHHGEHTIYPLLLIRLLRQRYGITAALFREKGRLVLAVEAGGQQLHDAAAYLAEQYGLPDIMIKKVRHIPRDPRHRTKVDYDRLRKLV